MQTVFLVWHIHEDHDDTDQKFIGVYRTREDAEAAVRRVSDKPGFRDSPEGFDIYEHVIGRDGWTEGFISEAEALQE